MTEEEMRHLAASLNAEMNKLVPHGTTCIMLLYADVSDSEANVITCSNVHPKSARAVIKAALDIVDHQLAATTALPANDVPPVPAQQAAVNKTAEPRCRYCRRPVQAKETICAQCSRMAGGKVE